MDSLVKPNLFIPGSAKSGTSSLHEYLDLHPSIFMSKTKEPHFFSNEELYFSNSKRTEYYDLFQEGKGFKYRGESSTGYMIFLDSIERIKSEIENPKFIFILRNPIDRIFSHYNWARNVIGNVESFNEEIKIEREAIPNYKNRFSGIYKYYYQFGMYYRWLKEFYAVFGKDNILIILNEELRNDPLTTLNSCFDFLELPRLNKISLIKSNETNYSKNLELEKKLSSILRVTPSMIKISQKIDPRLKSMIARFRRFIIATIKLLFKQRNNQQLTFEQRKELMKFYEEDFHNLKKLTKKDFSLWKDFE